MENELKKDIVPELVEQAKSPALSMLECAINSKVSPDQLLQYYEIHKLNEENEARKSFARDMALAQGAMPSVKKDSFNDQTKSWYSSIQGMLPLIKPIYTKYGFSLIYSEGKADKEGWVRTVCDVMHKDGYTKDYYNDLPLDNAGIKGTVNKTPIHSIGSTKSYGRRYITAMIFNLDTGDDNDGNSKGKTVDLIRDEDVIFLEKRIREVGANLSKFLAYSKLDKLSDMPVSHFSSAIKNLNEKEKANKK